MLFNLNPTLRHLAFVLPVLLTATPAAISADLGKVDTVLPPASLYDVPPTGQPTSAAPPPSESTPTAVTPAAPPPAAKAVEPVKATSSPTPQAAASTEPVKATSSAAPQAAPTAGEPTEPWYTRVVHWLFGKPATQAKAQPTPGPQPVASAPASVAAAQPVVVAEANSSVPAGESPRQGSSYASDASNRTIRTGMTGECVRMGAAAPDTANGDCHSAQVAGNAPPKPAPATVTAKSVAAGSATVVAMNQLPKPMPAGSAPAPSSAREYAPKIEPVVVVPLPPQPPAASEERPLEAEHVQNAEEEPITALAAMTPMMSEPEFDKLSLSASGLFALSSNKIKPTGQEKLDEMVEHLKGMQYDKVLIVGYTDPTGPRALNDKLSKQRADSVKQYLVSKGVDPKRIKTEGKGGAEPLAKTQDCDSLPRAQKIACYAPDRRVEIEVVGGSPHG